MLTPLKPELEEIFILSDLEIISDETASADVTKTSAARCERCWRHRSEVGSSAVHPTLCPRCEQAVTAIS